MYEQTPKTVSKYWKMYNQKKEAEEEDPNLHNFFFWLYIVQYLLTVWGVCSYIAATLFRSPWLKTPLMLPLSSSATMPFFSEVVKYLRFGLLAALSAADMLVGPLISPPTGDSRQRAQFGSTWRHVNRGVWSNCFKSAFLAVCAEKNSAQQKKSFRKFRSTAKVMLPDVQIGTIFPDRLVCNKGG